MKTKKRWCSLTSPTRKHKLRHEQTSIADLFGKLREDDEGGGRHVEKHFGQTWRAGGACGGLQGPACFVGPPLAFSR